MVLAAVRDDTYNIMLFIHLAAFLVAFAPAALNPILERHMRTEDDGVVARWAGFAAGYTQRIVLPGLVVLLATGVIMILLSEDVWEFSQTWISAAFLVWFAIAGVVSAMILKGERQASEGEKAGLDLVARGGQIATLLTIVMVYLMVWKPGF